MAGVLKPIHFDVEFTIGEIVFHVTEDDPVRGVVVAYYITAKEITYCVAWGGKYRNEETHFAHELSKCPEPNFHVSGADNVNEDP